MLKKPLALPPLPAVVPPGVVPGARRQHYDALLGAPDPGEIEGPVTIRAEGEAPLSLERTETAAADGMVLLELKRDDTVFGYVGLDDEDRVTFYKPDGTTQILTIDDEIGLHLFRSETDAVVRPFVTVVVDGVIKGCLGVDADGKLAIIDDDEETVLATIEDAAGLKLRQSAAAGTARPFVRFLANGVELGGIGTDASDRVAIFAADGTTVLGTLSDAAGIVARRSAATGVFFVLNGGGADLGALGIDGSGNLALFAADLTTVLGYFDGDTWRAEKMRAADEMQSPAYKDTSGTQVVGTQQAALADLSIASSTPMGGTGAGGLSGTAAGYVPAPLSASYSAAAPTKAEFDALVDVVNSLKIQVDDLAAEYTKCNSDVGTLRTDHQELVDDVNTIVSDANARFGDTGLVADHVNYVLARLRTHGLIAT